MATNIKEYVRESVKQYLALIKTKVYTKSEVDALVAAIEASDIALTNYQIATALGDILATDTVDVALGKLEYRLAQLPDMSTKADLIGGKVPTSQLPDTVLGALQYQGVWDAAANTPDIGGGTPEKGDYYVVSVTGTTNLSGITDWTLSDWAVYDGTAWSKLDRTPETVILSGNSIVAPFTDVTPAEAQSDWDNS